MAALNPDAGLFSGVVTVVVVADPVGVTLDVPEPDVVEELEEDEEAA
jgi:hypothetical protein